MSELPINNPSEDEEVRVASERSDDIASLRSDMTDLREKVDRILQHIAATTTNDTFNDPEEEGLQEARRGKKRPREDADEAQPSTIRVRLNPGAASSANYVTKTKEPNIPLPDPFDGNPRHLKEFLTELDLCFRASQSKYATDNV